MTVSVWITSQFELSPPIEAAWLANLPPTRRAQLSDWQDLRARHRSLIGSRLLTHGLRRLGFSGDVLATLRYPLQSRPTLALPVDFSLSHCEGRIVCALSTQGAVGIDVEALGGLSAQDFHLYFSAAERTWAGRSAPRFYTVWTRKEAVVKAASERGLRDVARVDTARGEQLALFDSRLWHTLRVPVGRGHVSHLALAEQPQALRFHRVSQSAMEREISIACADTVR